MREEKVTKPVYILNESEVEDGRRATQEGPCATEISASCCDSS